MKFRAVTSDDNIPATPEALFDELPRMAGAIPELWRQQVDVLREYARDFHSRSDVAIELPTGTGKTLVGLLVADWRRRRYAKPVLFACPTQQLARQVMDAARTQSIPASLMIDSHHTWDMPSVSRYEGADAVGITTYSAIFNSSPKVGAPGSILFDDAHAGEQYVGQAYAIQLTRTDDAWDRAIEALKPALDVVYLNRIQQDSPDAVVRNDVRLIVPSRHPGMTDDLDRVLSRLPRGHRQSFNYSMLRTGLRSCLVYVTWGQIYVRPFIAPTADNSVFESADQRLYLSATLGAAGELERAFGRTSIRRLALPPETEPRSGRRLILFPNLATPGEEDATDAILQASGKALILAPTTHEANESAELLRPDGWRILDPRTIVESLQEFAVSRKVLLPLAGRYDGLDLADDACRLLIMDGLPNKTHLQELFLADKLRATAALAERIRSRIVQGSGRATRGPGDHAIVLIRSDDVTRYLSQKGTRESLGLDLQAEVTFGHVNSLEASQNDLIEAARTFLDQGEDWRTQAEPLIVQARRQARRVLPEGTAELSASAEYEVRASAYAWRHDYVSASAEAARAAATLSGVEALRSYRSFWLYLAFVWAEVAATNGEQSLSIAQGLYHQADSAAARTSWLRQTDRGNLALQESLIDTPAIRAVCEILSTKRRSQTDARITEMTTGLAQTDHRQVEPALTTLGYFLGAQAWKPTAQGRCDSAWVWDRALWIAVEAKTEHHPHGELPLADVRKVMTQLSSLEGDLGVTRPAGSFSVIISPKIGVSADTATAATAHDDIFLVHPDELQILAARVASAWPDLYVKTVSLTGVEFERAVRRIMSDHQILPTNLLEAFRKYQVSA